MNEQKSIHNLGGLDKEIYRLKLEAEKIEGKLNQNLDHLHDNYFSMLMGSFSCKKGDTKRQVQYGLWKYIFGSDKFKATASSIANRIAVKASEGLRDWLQSFAGKKS